MLGAERGTRQGAGVRIEDRAFGEEAWAHPETHALAMIARRADPIGALYELIGRPGFSPDRTDWSHVELFEWLLAVAGCSKAVEARLSETRSGRALSEALTRLGAGEALVAKVRAAERRRGAREEAEQLEEACVGGRRSGARAL